MGRQGERYELLPANGRKSMSIISCEWFSVRTGICSLYVQCKPQMTVKASAEAALPIPPSESPRYFAAGKDESTIVGYYTLKKCRSPNRNPKFTADIQQKGAIWQETTGLTVPLQEIVI